MTPIRRWFTLNIAGPTDTGAKGPSITQLTAALLARIDGPGARADVPAGPRAAAATESRRS
jgi:hypothetical protein